MKTAKRDWLWDRKISISEAKKALKNPQDEKFIIMASLLLARKIDAQEVFRNYLDPLLFCRHWLEIKRRMCQDKWTQNRIFFWQAVYERLLNRYRKKDISFRAHKDINRNALCEAIGSKIQATRKEKGFSQKQLANKARISQQLVSRIERGEENVSLVTLSKISSALASKVEINFRNS